MRLIFCLFADSIGLLPDHAFRRLVTNNRTSPINFNRMLPVLLQAMSQPSGFFGADLIPYFNGDLFRPDDDFIALNHADLGILHSAAQHDWSTVEPAIFGTLFERSLDAAKRSMIGAHYTSTEDILLLVEPVVMESLRRRWATVQQSVLHALAEEAALATTQRAPRLGLNRPALTLLQDWAVELSAVRILDPACGSGNFLYVALKRLLDLWHEARVFGLAHGLTLALDPIPHPGQLFGIEIDFYAHEIASIVVWIGFLQWKHDHGIKDHKEPLLQKLTNLEHADAILRYDPEGKPYEPTWPAADFIIGNPPFLTGSKLRREFEDTYVEQLFALYDARVPGAADLVCYWIEKARAALESRNSLRVGLIGTQAIRGGASRTVLQRVTESASIFMAWSDRNWSLEGAMVHVSFIAFDSGKEQTLTLDGLPVDQINPNLTSKQDTSRAKPLAENAALWAYGSQSKGSFGISAEIARKLLSSVSPFRLNYSDIVKRNFNGKSLLDGKLRWVIDFGEIQREADAALYEAPFEYIKKIVKQERQHRREKRHQTHWWLHARPSPKYREMLRSQARYLATPATSKHRVFTWLSPDVLADHAIIVFARQDDYFFGVLQSIAHEQWARGTGTQVREAESGFRYTPSSTFDTFPFPYPPGTEPAEADSPIVRAIAEAARELVRLRDNWLNPKDADGNPLAESDLKKRTLTNLYNERPTWLANAHRTLDRAVFAAYGWPEDPATLPKQDILARLLALNHERAAAQPPKPAKASRRKLAKEPQPAHPDRDA